VKRKKDLKKVLIISRLLLSFTSLKENLSYQRRKVDKLVELEGGWVDRREKGGKVRLSYRKK